MKIKEILLVLLALVISAIITITTNTKLSIHKEPTEAYRVYLEGNSIGLIKSKAELENFIDHEQQTLKEKYKVDKVYAPNDLDITKELTFEDEILTIKQIYEKIKDVETFTVKGYSVTIPNNNDSEDNAQIKSKEKITFYILDKQILVSSLEKVIKAFVGTENYEKFAKNTQEEIKKTGTHIEDIYLDNQKEMTIAETFISTDKEIIMTVEELTQFLIFGTTEKQKSYTVKSTDTISQIAYENKMSEEEFLIANPELKDVNALLYEGQIVTLGILSPKIDVVEEKEVIKEEIIKYKTDYQYDNTLMTGYSKVLQAGSNGSSLVTQKIKTVNGVIENAIISNNQEVVPVVNEIILKGGRQPSITNAGNWTWPTNVPYIITSPFGWRWGKFHEGIDISGTGYGSPIYAAYSGTVITSAWHNTSGYYVIIEGDNGYFTIYAHLANKSKYISEGDHVKGGTVIGDMGSTGYSTGTHLHFSICENHPYSSYANCINPFLFY